MHHSMPLTMRAGFRCLNLRQGFLQGSFFFSSIICPKEVLKATTALSLSNTENLNLLRRATKWKNLSKMHWAENHSFQGLLNQTEAKDSLWWAPLLTLSSVTSQLLSVQAEVCLHGELTQCQPLHAGCILSACLSMQACSLNSLGSKNTSDKGPGCRQEAVAAHSAYQKKLLKGSQPEQRSINI